MTPGTREPRPLRLEELEVGAEARRQGRFAGQDPPSLRLDEDRGTSDVGEAEPGHAESESVAFAWLSAQSSA